MNFIITQKNIEAAHQKIGDYLICTPLVFSHYLSAITGANIFLKCEHLQHTGSFKFRGALNKILSLTEEQKKQGIIAASTGNHGLAVAQAAYLTQTQATIFLPQEVSDFKKEAIKQRGAQIQYVKGDCLQAELVARQAAKIHGKIYISPYNDAVVIAGQGTIGIELLEKLPKLDAVFVAVGGGGLISGIGSYLKALSPTTQVIGCWPSNAPAMHECLKAGKIISIHEKPTLSEATAGNVEPDSITFPICQKVIDESLLVSEQEITQALTMLAEQEHWITEGAAGVALAAFLKVQAQYKGKNVAIVLCGRNITLSDFIQTVGVAFR